MKPELNELGSFIIGMHKAYANGSNAMAWARETSTCKNNVILSTLIAYDLQAGNYIAQARANPEYVKRWCGQIADLIRPYVEPGDQIMEVGVGEATTLAGVIKSVNCHDMAAKGFDISWSRIKVAQEWIKENSVDAYLLVGDLFHIPMADNSIDVIYTSHSLEPNGGKEELALKELLRVARKAVVMIEPIYELASEDAKKRMDEHGYVRGLKSAAEKLGAIVVEYGLLNVVSNPLNPSGVVLIVKSERVQSRDAETWNGWQCPLTGFRMIDHGDIFYAEQVGIAYPIMRGVPLLRPEHGVIASKIY